MWFVLSLDQEISAVIFEKEKKKKMWGNLLNQASLLPFQL